MTADTHLTRPPSSAPGPETPVGGLSPRLRLLCVARREPTWINLTLHLDAEGCVEPQFRWASTSAEAMSVLRSESFDGIFIETEPGGSTDRLDGLSLLRALRASGHDDPVVLLAESLDDHRWAEASRQDCEVLVTAGLWESPALVPVLKRAVRSVELNRENHWLALAHHRRLVRERDEAEHLLHQQRQMIADLHPHRPAPASEPNPTEEAARRRTEVDGGLGGSRPNLPEEVKDHYQELLRTYVIMGSGSLGRDIAQLAEIIAMADLNPRETLQFHLERVETLVRGLGQRSTRHVMARADLLALELMVHLGECYQRRGRPSE